MNSVRSASVGTSSQKASAASRSSIRLTAPRLESRPVVDLANLFMRPRHRGFGRHALDCLGVHVGDDVLGQHLGGLPVRQPGVARRETDAPGQLDRKSTRLNSSHGYISYAVFCLKKKTKLTQVSNKS